MSSAAAETNTRSSERKSSSFSNGGTKQIKGNKRIKPLTREFFTLLIKLEADFHNKQYSVTTLDELIQYYAKAVEYYDSIKDEISSYFIFKIQDILATKKSLKMLLEQNNKTGLRRGASTNMDEPIEEQPTNTNAHSSSKKVTFADGESGKGGNKQNIVEESSGEEDEEEKHMTELEKRRRAKKVDRKDRISISTMKNQKQRFVNFFYKMEIQKVSEKQNMQALMNEFGTSSDKNDLYVKKDMDGQKERLRRRLDKRKNEILSQTMNGISFHAGGSAGYDEHQEKKDTERMFESFLDELDGMEGSGSRHMEGSERVDTESENYEIFRRTLSEDGESKSSPIHRPSERAKITALTVGSNDKLSDKPDSIPDFAIEGNKHDSQAHNNIKTDFEAIRELADTPLQANKSG